MKALLDGFGRSGCMRFLRLLARARDGGVAMMFALSLPVLTMAAVAGVDFHRISSVRANLQDALDAATLAAARSNLTTQAAVQQLGRAVLDANLQPYPSISLESASFTLDTTTGEVQADATVDVTTLVANIFLPPYGQLMDDQVPVSVRSVVVRGGVNVEMALVLDVTFSMDSCTRNCPPTSKLTELQDAARELIDSVVQPPQQQTPYYSRAAIVPYSMAVNLGSRAAAVRGAVPGSRPITQATWASGQARNISGIAAGSWQNNNRPIVTASGHGLNTGDGVYISGLNGASQINDRTFTVVRLDANRFELNGISSFSTYRNGGQARRCQRSDCAVTITAAGHGFRNNDRVHVTGQGAPTNPTQRTFTATGVSGSNLVLAGSTPAAAGYMQGGALWCAAAGCQYFDFANAAGGRTTFEISTCASERSGSQAYTDAAPSSAQLGRVYTITPGPPGQTDFCPQTELLPLTSDRNTLRSRIDGLSVAGSTAGHIGLAWGWYALSPNFSGVLGGTPAAAYDAPHTLKAVVLMTDGEFNSVYCDGVVSRSSTTGSGGAANQINCNAPNGASFAQARSLCASMKAQDVIIYAVGFDLPAQGSARDVMHDCASSNSHVFLPNSGADLREAFRAIAQNIAELRIAR